MSAPTVNTALTTDRPGQARPARNPRQPRRRRDVVENDDYAAFTRRILAAHGRRIAAGDIEGLADLAALSAQVDTAISTAVAGLRHHGYSWADIGARLGTTRQAAQQRWGDRP
ncbi:MAG: hypothetical protein ACRDRK_00755 [Pseudonocardia sp.]